MDESKMTELNKALEGIWDSLTDEQKAKAKECRSMDELASLAGKAGVKLPNEMLESVAGGLCGYQEVSKCDRTYGVLMYCPYCKAAHEHDIICKKGEEDYHFCDKTRNSFKEKDGKYYDMEGKYLGDFIYVDRVC